MFNSDISENCQFEGEKFKIWNILKISNVKNSKNLQFGQCQKFPIWKIPKPVSSENF